MGTTQSAAGRDGDAGTPLGRGRPISVLDKRLQARLQRGVDLNVKVVVRGARGVGKSTLLRRLEGKRPADFLVYTPTREIAVSHIHWKNPGADSSAVPAVIKVEAWDVVDEALDESADTGVMHCTVDADAPAGLPLTAAMRARSGSVRFGLLDASAVDVYKNASAALVLYDPRREGSFEHAHRLALDAPPSLPLLLIATFHDLCAGLPERQQQQATDRGGDSDDNNDSNAKKGVNGGQEGNHGEVEAPRVVPRAKVSELLAALSRDGARRAQHLVCSARTSFGLKVLYSYLRIPYLCAWRRQLMEQVHLCEENLARASAEVDQEIAAAGGALVPPAARQRRPTVQTAGLPGGLAAFHSAHERTESPLSTQSSIESDLPSPPPRPRTPEAALVKARARSSEQPQVVERETSIEDEIRNIPRSAASDQKALDAFFADGGDSDEEEHARKQTRARAIVETYRM